MQRSLTMLRGSRTFHSISLPSVSLTITPHMLFVQSNSYRHFNQLLLPTHKYICLRPPPQSMRTHHPIATHRDLVSLASGDDLARPSQLPTPICVSCDSVCNNTTRPLRRRIRPCTTRYING